MEANILDSRLPPSPRLWRTGRENDTGESGNNTVESGDDMGVSGSGTKGCENGMPGHDDTDAGK